ncbi:MAG: FHA domain-containing protein [Oscillospiraceae bacterium]|nr:FHA domain-containing protein [Oscillospiraceae bacterium]
MQTYIDDDKLDIVARGDFDLQSADVKVSNQQSEIAECGTVSEGKIRVRTTVLVDVSTSMPYDTRAKVIEFIEEKIKELAGYEEIRLVTFGDKIDVVQDFSSDRYDLSSAAKEIEFNGMASAVYDAINSTISHPKAEDGSPCFYRTIVMTDGIDDTAGGITKEELFMQLRTETYPIDVIGVSADKLSNPDKDLAALSRISNGSYAELYSGSDVLECVSKVSASDLFWIRAEVPVDLLDGSTRQVDISDGKNSFSFDMKMSVVDVPIESSVSSSVVESSAPTFAPPESLPANETSDGDESEKLDSKNIILIAAVGGCVLIAAVLVAVLSSVKRKKKKRTNEALSVELYTLSNEIDDGKTELLIDDSLQSSYTIRLSSCSDSRQNWTVAITKDVIVGRADSCELKFSDSSVSREQFKLIACDTGIMLSNLSSSNITQVNNVVATSDIMLQLGDIIKFGRVSLSVDLIQKISGNVHSDNGSSGDTLTVF